MLEGHSGEVIVGLIFAAVAAAVLWTFVRAALAGIATREDDRRHVNRQS